MNHRKKSFILLLFNLFILLASGLRSLFRPIANIFHDPKISSSIDSMNRKDSVNKILAISLGLMIPFINFVPESLAYRDVGNIPTSGLIFKDSLKVHAFEDPKVSGVVLYLSEVDRPITEKISNDFFNDPSSSSIACARVAPISVSNSVNLSPEGEEVFEESRNLFFKQIRVRRVIDKDTKTLIYVAYNTRFDKNSDDNKSRFKSSLCAIHIE